VERGPIPDPLDPPVDPQPRLYLLHGMHSVVSSPRDVMCRLSTSDAGCRRGGSIHRIHTLREHLPVKWSQD